MVAVCASSNYLHMVRRRRPKSLVDENMLTVSWSSGTEDRSNRRLVSCIVQTWSTHILYIPAKSQKLRSFPATWARRQCMQQA